MSNLILTGFGWSEYAVAAAVALKGLDGKSDVAGGWWISRHHKHLLKSTDINRGCTPSPAWVSVVGEVGLPGSGGARMMSAKGLSL